MTLPYRALDYRDVVDGARTALPADQADAVLRHNPARLCGFAPD